MRKYFSKHQLYVIYTTGALGILLSILPVAYLVIWSLFGTDVVGHLEFPFTLKWYGNTLSDPTWQNSIIYSFVIALSTSLIGCLVLLIYNYLHPSLPEWLRQLTFVLALLSLVNPLLAYAMSLRYTLSITGLPEYLVLLMGHLVIVFPVQFFIFEASRKLVDSERVDGAWTLGASHFRTLLFVYIPLTKVVWISAFVVGFFVSFDEVVIASILIDSSAYTVPLKLWLERSSEVEPHAATISVLILVLLLSVALAKVFLSDSQVLKKGYSSVEAIWDETWRELLGGTITFIITLVIFRQASPSTSWLTDIILSSVTSIIAAFLVSAYRLKSAILPLLSLASSDHWSISRKFAEKAVLDVVNNAQKLARGQWTEMGYEHSRALVIATFQKTKDSYFGTDSNVPSKYKNLYPNYLEAQTGSHASSNNRISLRFLLVTRPELIEDFKENREIVRDFIEDNRVAGVHLLVVNPETAKNQANQLSLPSSDLGIFDNEIVFYFKPRVEVNAVQIKVQHGEIDVETATQYLKHLTQNALRVTQNSEELIFTDLSSDEVSSTCDILDGKDA